jgi:hypothetical protein
VFARPHGSHCRHFVEALERNICSVRPGECSSLQGKLLEVRQFGQRSENGPLAEVRRKIDVSSSRRQLEVHYVIPNGSGSPNTIHPPQRRHLLKGACHREPVPSHASVSNRADRSIPSPASGLSSDANRPRAIFKIAEWLGDDVPIDKKPEPTRGGVGLEKSPIRPAECKAPGYARPASWASCQVAAPRRVIRRRDHRSRVGRPQCSPAPDFVMPHA